VAELKQDKRLVPVTSAGNVNSYLLTYQTQASWRVLQYGQSLCDVHYKPVPRSP